MTDFAYLLRVKQASIQMLGAAGYDITEDKNVLGYSKEDMPAFFDWAKADIKENGIRSLLKNNRILTNRTSMSTIYESLDRPNHYAVVYFTPTPPPTTNSISKSVIQGPVSLCTLFPFSKRKHCAACVHKLNSMKRCVNCPLQQYCTDCLEGLKCSKCVTDKWCSSCTVRLRKWNNYRLSLQYCESCPGEGTESPYCKECLPARQHYSCRDCTRTKEGELAADVCQPCMEKLKCPTCKEGAFCKDCEKTKDFEPCDQCPEAQLCRKCLTNSGFEPCEKCPESPQIIERFVIITQVALSPDAKSTATGNIPRIKSSTGEWLETGCLIQIFLDRNILSNPLIHSYGSSYKILTIDEVIALFANKDNTVTENQIHQMDYNEIIARYLGLFPGMVVRVCRKNVVPGGSTSHEIIYRAVKAIPNVRKTRRRVLKKQAAIPVSSIQEE